MSRIRIPLAVDSQLRIPPASAGEDEGVVVRALPGCRGRRICLLPLYEMGTQWNRSERTR
jgi:hypothetical protein